LLSVVSDVPLATSSSDDSNAEDWLNRYEEKQRKKREERKLLDYALHSRTARDSDKNTGRSEVITVDPINSEEDYNYNGDVEVDVSVHARGAMEQRMDVHVDPSQQQLLLENRELAAVEEEGSSNDNNNVAVVKRKNYVSIKRYDHLFDDSDEIYIGAEHTQASVQLQAAVDQAAEYMRSNELYLASQAALAVGGSGGAHQVIGIYICMYACMYV